MNRVKSLLSIAAILSTFLFPQQSNAEDSKATINAGTDNSKPAGVSGYSPNRDPIVPRSTASGVGDSGRHSPPSRYVTPAK
jgi:hypothetical protein